MTSTQVPQNTLTHEQLLDALYFAHDLFSRPNIPFFLMGETAYQVKNRKTLEGNHIDVGIRKLDAGLPTLSIMDAFYTPEKVEWNKITYKFKEVPVVVHIVDSTDDMFRALDIFMYQHENFAVPNPFNKYWEEREKYL